MVWLKGVSFTDKYLRALLIKAELSEFGKKKQRNRHANELTVPPSSPLYCVINLLVLNLEYDGSAK